MLELDSRMTKQTINWQVDYEGMMSELPVPILAVNSTGHMIIESEEGIFGAVHLGPLAFTPSHQRTAS